MDAIMKKINNTKNHKTEPKYSITKPIGTAAIAPNLSITRILQAKIVVAIIKENHTTVCSRGSIFILRHPKLSYLIPFFLHIHELELLLRSMLLCDLGQCYPTYCDSFVLIRKVLVYIS